MSNDPLPTASPESQTPPPPPAATPGMQQNLSAPVAQAGSSAMTAPSRYAPNQDERTMGMLIHLLAIFTGFLGPLILWLVKREGSGFIDHNGKEAINFQISLVIYYAGLGILTVVTMFVGFIVTGPAMLLLWVASIVFEILCCVKANQGEWPRYPITIRFIK